MYKVPCPSCGVVNNLNTADLGKSLNCGACGVSFTFGEDILAERKREMKERAKRDADAKAREQREHEEAERRRRERQAAEEAAAAKRLAEYQPKHPAPQTPPALTEPESGVRVPAYEMLHITARVLHYLGFAVLIIAVTIGVVGLGQEYPDRVALLMRMQSIGIIIAGTVYGVATAGFGQALSALRDIARNSFEWRRGFR